MKSVYRRPAMPMKAPVFSRPAQRGLTLMEMVITIVILGIALTALVSAMAGMASRGADPLMRNRALALAQMYADEILGKRFDEYTPLGGGQADPGLTACTGLGPEGETRAGFDDVDDYQGLDDSPPRDQDGATLSAYQGFRVRISVSCHGGEFGLAEDAAKRVDILVDAPGQPTMTFSLYRGYF